VIPHHVLNGCGLLVEVALDSRRLPAREEVFIPLRLRDPGTILDGP